MKRSPLNFSLPCAAAWALLAVAAGFTGCTSYPVDTGNSGDVNGSFYYGAGVYNPWGYYGNPYYGYGGGGAVIITTPPHVSQPIARPRPR
jgi:hypothetical protein